MRRQFLIHFAYVFILSVLSCRANATVLNYDEAVSGDISNFTYIGMLDTGVNTIRGTVCFAPPSCPVGDFDFFLTDLPASTILESAELSLSNGINGDGNVAGTFEVISDAGAYILRENLPGFGNYTFLIGSNYSTMKIGLNGFGSGLVNDYVIKINVVSAIPLPASLPLYGSGLALMGIMGWRCKRKVSA